MKMTKPRVVILGLSLTVVGGGPTGVEMAGALAELAAGPLKSDHEHAAKHIKINLIEAGPRLLPTFSAKLSERTRKDLEKMGVQVFLNTAVAKVAPRKISIKDGADIPSEVTIWAAGVKGEPTAEILKLPTVRTRIDTTATLQVNHYPDIWAIGDIAGVTDKDGKLLPMVAPVALQQGGRNKVGTIADWTWNYLTFDRGNRHIMDIA